MSKTDTTEYFSATTHQWLVRHEVPMPQEALDLILRGDPGPYVLLDAGRPSLGRINHE